jgi:hypothetical protein
VFVFLTLVALTGLVLLVAICFRRTHQPGPEVASPGSPKRTPAEQQPFVAFPHVPGADDPPGLANFSGAACVICIEELHPGDLLVLLKCGHRYHAYCLEAWVARDASCPSCRVPAVRAAPSHGPRGGVVGATSRACWVHPEPPCTACGAALPAAAAFCPACGATPAVAMDSRG